MRKFWTILLAATLTVHGYGQVETSNDTLIAIEKSIIEPKDTFVEVTAIGVFDGNIINKYGYRINEYWIAITDLTGLQVDSLKGKRVMVTGKLKIVKGNEGENIQSTREDTKYITEPKFTIVYDSRHPLQKKMIFRYSETK